MAFCYTASAQSHKKNLFTDNYAVICDTSLQTMMLIHEDKDELTCTRLDNKELQLIDTLLKDAISDYNKKLEKEYKKRYGGRKMDISNMTIDLYKENYKRQCFAYVNKKGEKIVWVNCMCSEDPVDIEGWKSHLIIVRDGGKCYFNLKVDLAKKEAYDLRVNGEA
ncbi:MAG: hypothetical protein JST82_06500 [Bacteroidetes bacterium]|nr:hypothetical protein [Bacteroidota bacterium]